MSRPEFIACTATYKLINGYHVVQLSPRRGDPGYLMLQRAIDDADDSGIYIEFFHEMASGYDLLAEMRVSRDRVEVDLSETFARMTGIDITVALDDPSYGVFVNVVKLVFRGMSQQLRIADGADTPLFVVEQTYTIHGKGLALVGLTAEQCTLMQAVDRVMLRFADGSVREANVTGAEYPPSVKWTERPPIPRYGICVDCEEVPPGTAVYLVSRSTGDAPHQHSSKKGGA